MVHDTYLLIVATVLLPVNINKCVRDAPNNDKSFANAQTGTSANNSFGFNTTQHNTTQLKKSEDCHPPQPGGVMVVVVVVVMVVVVVDMEVGGWGWG